MKALALATFIFVILSGLPANAQNTQNSDDEIRQQLITDSIRQYPGTCACPYNRASNGSRCGRRSAYSRPGGHAPMCYRDDVSNEMVRRYRQRIEGSN